MPKQNYLDAIQDAVIKYLNGNNPANYLNSSDIDIGRVMQCYIESTNKNGVFTCEFLSSDNIVSSYLSNNDISLDYRELVARIVLAFARNNLIDEGIRARDPAQVQFLITAEDINAAADFLDRNRQDTVSLYEEEPPSTDALDGQSSSKELDFFGYFPFFEYHAYTDPVRE